MFGDSASLIYGQGFETRSLSITLRRAAHHLAAARPAARALRPGPQRRRLLLLTFEGGDLAQHPPEGARAARDVGAGAARAKRCGVGSGSGGGGERSGRGGVCVCGTGRELGQPHLGATAPKLSEARPRSAKLISGAGRRGGGRVGRRGGGCGGRRSERRSSSGRSCGRRCGRRGGGALEHEEGDGHKAGAAGMAHEEPALVAAAPSEQLYYVAHLRHERC